jgi:hypothetical protein
MILGVVLSLALFAAPARAATTISVSMTFTEGVSQQFGCTNHFGPCGSGQVVPLGHATEMIQFGQACGGTCDLRIITLATGSLFLDEFFSSFDCPGGCNSHGVGRPGDGNLTDVIVGGTGAFSGASGNVSGTVKSAGGSTQIKLAGPLSLP